MSINYQSLTGLFEITADQLVVDTLIVNTLIIPTGAVQGYVLTSDSFGVAAWHPDPNVNLLGDATGLLTANRVDTLAGGTIPVTSVVTLTGTQTLTNKTLTTPVITSISNGGTVTIPSGTGTLVTLAASQTLTNKTLTTPVISTIVNTGTLTLPTTTDVLVGKATTDILTNKTLTLPIITSISNTGILTLPTTTDTLVGKATTDILTNKTLSGNICGNLINTGTITFPTVTGTLSTLANAETLTNKIITGTTNSVDANSMRNGSTWVIPYSGASPATNNILTFNGTSAVWLAPSSAGNLTGDVTSVGLATTLTNAPVIAKVLTGFTAGAGTVAGTDSILSAFQKDVGNLSALTTVVGTPVSTATNNAIAKRDGSAGCAFNALTCTTLSSSGVATLNSVSCTNNMFVGSVLDCYNTIHSGQSTWSIPANQGAHMGWNRGVGSSGRTAFMNQQGGGAGGFEWLNYNSSNVLTSPNPLMTLDSSGILSFATLATSGNTTIGGTLVVSSTSNSTFAGSVGLIGTTPHLYANGGNASLAAYASGNGSYFSDTIAGDSVYRNTSGSLRFGTSSGVSQLQVTSTMGVNILGIPSNIAASPGFVGELVSSVVLSSSAVVTSSNNTWVQYNSISLTAGDWDVWGSTFFAISPPATVVRCWINNSTTTPDRAYWSDLGLTSGAINDASLNAPQRTFQLSATTTIYMGAYITFTPGFANLYGTLYARRRR